MFRNKLTSLDKHLSTNLKPEDINSFHKLVHALSCLNEDDDILRTDGFNEEWLLEKVKEVKSTDHLSENELNRYIFIVQKYIDRIKEKDLLKAQKLTSILVSTFLDDEKVNFLRKWKMVKNELFNLFSTWNYKKICERKDPKIEKSYFDIYADFIESEISNITNKKDNKELWKPEFLLRLDVLVNIFTNFCLCSFNYYTKDKIDTIWNNLLETLNKHWFEEYKLLVETSLYKNQLKKEEKWKQKISKDSKPSNIRKVCSNLESLNFPSKDRLQFLVTKLEVLINKGWNQVEINLLINDIDKIEKKEISLIIHFEFLQILFNIPKKGILHISDIKDKVLGLLSHEETIDSNLKISYITDLILLLIRKYDHVGNKVLLLEPLFLLIELEDNLEKKRKYFFLAWWHIEKHFHKIDNYFKDRIFEIWKDVFLPNKDLDSLSDAYFKYITNKENKQDHKELYNWEYENISDVLLGDLEHSLKNLFWINEIFISNQWLDDNITCQWFEKNTNCWNNICSEGYCQLKENSILSQLKEDRWVNISFYEDTIYWIINSTFFSEILVWKIINIFWERITVLISKWRNNNTNFLREELSRIELNYIRKYLEEIKKKELTKDNKELQEDKLELITSLEARNKELRKANQVLKETEDVKRTIGSMVHHEFNNMHWVVTWNIDLAIELLKEWGDINMIIKDLEAALNASYRLGKLRNMTQMMMDSNISINEIDLEINDISINNLLYELIGFQEIWTYYKEKEPIIRIELLDNINIESNEIALYFALFNIIWNSIKFSKNKWIIEINATEENDNVIISIKDDWVWIDTNDIPHLFKYRNQVGDEEKKKEWSWIWLYTAMQYIKALGWSIEVVSEKWVWTIFKVILPKNK